MKFSLFKPQSEKFPSSMETEYLCTFMVRLLFIFAAYCLFSGDVVFGQKPSRIELQHADVIEFDEAINRNADRLIGHVSFKHEDAVMTCDSAYLYKNENNLEAFGSVRINQGDTVT